MNDVIESLRAHARGKENAFAAYNHLELETLEEDRAVFRLDVRPESTNDSGYVHGGLLATLADNAAGYAAHTDGRLYVTQSCHIDFIGNQTGGSVWAEGRVVHRGRTVCLTRVEIRGENRRLLATGDLSFFHISD